MPNLKKLMEKGGDLLRDGLRNRFKLRNTWASRTPIPPGKLCFLGVVSVSFIASLQVCFLITVKTMASQAPLPGNLPTACCLQLEKF